MKVRDLFEQSEYKVGDRFFTVDQVPVIGYSLKIGAALLGTVEKVEPDHFIVKVYSHDFEVTNEDMQKYTTVPTDKPKVIKGLLTKMKTSEQGFRNSETMLDTLGILEKEFGANWPELETIRKSLLRVMEH